MSTENNKQVVSRFFDAMFRGDVDAARALMAEDATWWVPTNDAAGYTSTRDKVIKGAGRFVAAFKVPPRFEVTGMVAEGEFVTVEHIARGGITFSGNTYDNNYHSLCRLRDGLIREIREYMNPIMAGPIMAELQARRAEAQ